MLGRGFMMGVERSAASGVALTQIVKWKAQHATKFQVTYRTPSTN